jgi:hypothetical protein
VGLTPLEKTGRAWGRTKKRLEGLKKLTIGRNNRTVAKADLGEGLETLEEHEEAEDEEEGGEHGPEDHPVVEVVEARLGVEGGHEGTPSGLGAVGEGLGVDNAAGPGGEGGSEGVEVVLDREADVPAEDHSDEHGAEGPAVTDEEVVLGESGGVLVGHEGENNDDEDREERENSSGPHHSLQVTPESVKVAGEKLGLINEFFTLEVVASGVALDGDSRSAVEDDLVLVDPLTSGSVLVVSLEDGLESHEATNSSHLAGNNFGSGSAPSVHQGALVGKKPLIVVHKISELSVLLVVTEKGTTSSCLEVVVDEGPGRGLAHVGGLGVSGGVLAREDILGVRPDGGSRAGVELFEVSGSEGRLKVDEESDGVLLALNGGGGGEGIESGRSAEGVPGIDLGLEIIKGVRDAYHQHQTGRTARLCPFL